MADVASLETPLHRLSILVGDTHSFGRLTFRDWGGDELEGGFVVVGWGDCCFGFSSLCFLKSASSSGLAIGMGGLGGRVGSGFSSLSILKAASSPGEV